MAGLLADLSLKISANTAELNKGLDKAKGSVNKFGKETKSNGKKVNGAFSKIGDSAKGLGSQITNQMGIAGGAINGLASSFTGVLGGLKGATSALQVFKVALLSTGVGALVVGLGALVTYFTKTQKGADFVSKSMAGIGAVADVIIDTVSSLGEMIFNAFSSPQEALKDMGNAIKNFILRRFEQLIGGLKGIGTAFKLLFEGEFKEAAKTAGTALKDIAMSTTPLGLAMSVVSDNLDIIKEKYGEASREAKKAMKLEKEAIALEEKKMKDRLRSAKLQVELSELIRKSKEKENFTEKERLQFVKDAQVVQQKLSDIQIQNAKEELRIKSESDKLANNMREDDKATIELKTKLILLDKEANDKQRELQNRVNEANNALGIAVTKQQKLNEEKEHQLRLENELKGIGVSLTLNEDDAKDELQKSAENVAGLIKPVTIPTKMQIDKAEAEAAAQDMKKKVVSSMTNVTDVLGHANSEISNAFAGLMSKQTAELENHYAREKELIQNSTMSAREKAKAITALEEKTAQKRKGIQQKQAKADKASALMGAIVNVAQAVTKAMTAGPVVGQILAGITAAMGAVQVATIASTPIPKFFSGGIVQGSPTGDQNLIRANGGEMMLNKSQQSNMFDMINKGGTMGRSQKIHISGRLVGEGSSLVAVIDETTQRQNRNF